MGTAESTAELTLADIENQLTEEERCKVCHGQLAPRFSRGLSPETVVSIADRHRFTVEGQLAGDRTRAAVFRCGGFSSLFILFVTFRIGYGMMTFY